MHGQRHEEHLIHNYVYIIRSRFLTYNINPPVVRRMLSLFYFEFRLFIVKLFIDRKTIIGKVFSVPRFSFRCFSHGSQCWKYTVFPARSYHSVLQTSTHVYNGILYYIDWLCVTSWWNPCAWSQYVYCIFNIWGFSFGFFFLLILKLYPVTLSRYIRHDYFLSWSSDLHCVNLMWNLIKILG